MVALLGSIERRWPRAAVYLGVGVVLTRWWLGLVNGEIVSFEQSFLLHSNRRPTPLHEAQTPTQRCVGVARR